jgi:hypothetical protein
VKLAAAALTLMALTQGASAACLPLGGVLSGVLKWETLKGAKPVTAPFLVLDAPTCLQLGAVEVTGQYIRLMVADPRTLKHWKAGDRIMVKADLAVKPGDGNTMTIEASGVHILSKPPR